MLYEEPPGRKWLRALGVDQEKLLNEERDGPATAYLQSLNMLVCTEGRERTASEYEVLVKEAGFSELQVRRTGEPVDAILALKR